MFVKVLNETLKAIADAVRSKTGETEKMKPSEIPDKIKGIQGNEGGSFDSSSVADASHQWGDYVGTEKDIHSGIYMNQNMNSYTNSNLARITPNHAFQGNKLVSFLAPNLTTIGGTFLFSGCTKLKKAEISTRITNLPQATFYSCRSLQSIPNSETLQRINGQAFSFCGSLEEAVLPNVTNILSNAFSTCTGLEKVILPSLLTLEGYTFSYCHGLKLFDIGENCTAVDRYAFFGSNFGLTLIVRATTPPTLRGLFALGGQGQITSIKVPAEAVNAYKTANNWKNYADIITAI